MFLRTAGRSCHRHFCTVDAAALVSWSSRTVAVGKPPRKLVEGLDLTLRSGERWAVLGVNGCGKSTVAQQILESVHASHGEPGEAASQARARSISFEAHRRLLLGELKEFRESRFEVQHKRATVASYLFPDLYPIDPAWPHGYDGFTPARTRLAPLPVPHDAQGDHPLLAELEAAASAGRAAELLQHFDLLDIRHRPIHGLSTGQLRKLMLTECLLSPPELLVLDEAFDGLDRDSRIKAMHQLDELASSTLVLITHRLQDLMFSPTHALLLGQGPEGTDYKVGPWSQLESSATEALSTTIAVPSESGLKTVTEERLTTIGEEEAANRPALVEFRDVSISYGEHNVFQGLSWIVREGENWAVLGANGSGKSTLIELISGDNVLAYEQDITLFGRQKGSGESVWDIKRQLGVISTAFHMEYANYADPNNRWYAKTHSHITTWDVVCSGFFDSIGLYDEIGASKQDIARHWIERFGLGDLITPPEPDGSGLLTETRQDFFRLSFGQQKLVLLCRAMVKSPRLLLLDEPSHGLAGPVRGRLLRMLDILAKDPTVALVHVTHRQDEIEALGFQNVLRL